MVKSIIGKFNKQEWINDTALSVDIEKFDATSHVLNMGLSDIWELEDNQYSTDHIGEAYVEHNGPFEVEITESICEFFGVDNLEEITQNMIDEAKSLHVEKVGKIKIRMVLDIEYDLEPDGADDYLAQSGILRNNMRAIVDYAMGEGLFTGDAFATVSDHDISIVNIEDTVEKEVGCDSDFLPSI